MVARQWTVQRVEHSEERLRFYSPHSWTLLGSVAMTLFSVAAVELVRRGFVPAWILVGVFLITAFVIAASIDAFRRSPEGQLHFQIDRTKVSFGGFAFRAVASPPHSVLKRVFVGDRYLSLVAPVLFEFHPAAIEAHGLTPYRSFELRAPVVVRSYRGVTRDAFQTALGHFLPAHIPVIQFTVFDSPAQFESQTWLSEQGTDF